MASFANRARAGLLALLALLAAGEARALNVTFDYTYAAGTFLDDPAVQALLDQAAAEYAPLTDALGRIDQSEHPAGNTWSARITEPTSGVSGTSIPNLIVPDDTLIVFVGARDLGGTTAGQAAPGGWSISFTGNAAGQAWLDLVDARGQLGEFDSPATDFGPWGGWISFDSDTNWNLAAGLPSAGQVDFLSVAIHELGHVFGFGSSDSWSDQINFGDGTFVGATAESVYGAPVPLADSAHWSNSGITPEPALDPIITTGARKLLTPLDYAGLADIGWEVPLALLPEPDTGVLVSVALVLLVGVASTRRAAQPRPGAGRPPLRRAPAPRRGRRRSRGWAPARG